MFEGISKRLSWVCGKSKLERGFQYTGWLLGFSLIDFPFLWYL